jgi:hypothetical protein
MLLSRQVPVLPVGMVLGGWLWASLSSRRLRNPWSPFVITVLPVTAACYLAVARWAPYDALPFLLDKTHSSNLAELLRRAPQMWGETLRVDWTALWAHDRPTVAVTAVGLVGLVLAFRNPVAGVFLGSLASGVVTELLNGQPNDFRYLSPSLPPLLLLGGLAIAWVGHQLLRRVRDGAIWPGQALLRPEPRPATIAQALPDGRVHLVRPEPAGHPARGWAANLAASAAWLLVGGLVWGAAAVHPQAPIAAAEQEQLAEASWPHPWPFSVPEGTLICAGQDYQMWFMTPDGQHYALSGTAMAASFGEPRALQLQRSSTPYGWPAIKPILTEGMHLCGAHRGFQQPLRKTSAPVKPGPATRSAQSSRPG